jgi:hypothetical protein
MGYSGEAFIQFQERQYQETEIYQLKQQLLTQPAAPKQQQVKNPTKNGKHGK